MNEVFIVLQGRKEPMETPMAPPQDAFGGYLPRSLVSLIGRDTDLERATALLLEPGTRLLTFIGPAGVGKTSLALETARAVRSSFRDGVWFVDLSVEHEAEAILNAVSRTLGVSERGADHGLALRQYLHERQILLVLDNLEQISGAASIVSGLLAGGDVRLLTTSRQPLHLRAERRFPVKPLPVTETPLSSASSTPSPAVQLYLARALEANPDFRLDATNAADIALLCTRLDGLPLALELAASRADTLSPSAILAHLEAHGGVPWMGAADSPDRHRSLQAALDWSFDLLDDAHKTLLRRLGVFAGSFDVSSVAAVADTAALGLDPLLSLAELCDRNLVIPVQRADGARFKLLVIVRDYALERLQSSGELELLRARHADFFIDLGEQLQRGGAPEATDLVRVDLESDNMDEALRWALTQASSQDNDVRLFRLATLRAAYWSLRGQLTQARRWYEITLTRIPEHHLEMRARLMMGIVQAATIQGELQAARTLSETTLELVRRLPESPLLGRMLLRHANLLNAQGDVTLATAAAEEGLEVIRHAEQGNDLLGALATLASVKLDQGEPARSEALVSEALTLARERGNTIMVASLLGFLAATVYFQGDSKRAIPIFEEALERLEVIGDEVAIAQTCANFADTWLSLDDADRARPLYERSVMLFKRTNSLRSLPDVLIGLSQLELFQHNTVRAAAGLLEVLALSEAHPRQISNALCATAQLAVATRQPHLAVVLLGAAEGHLQAHDMGFLLRVQTLVDEVLEGVRQHLEPEALRQAWEEGRTTALNALLEVLNTTDWTSDEPIDTRPSDASSAPPDLSERELEVLRLVAQGLSNKRVAKALGLSDNTVKFHLNAVFNKLGCRTRAEATRLAMERGLV
jgi:predicted ATPase/DNA-binding NarL/FixJ family response regulator